MLLAMLGLAATPKAEPKAPAPVQTDTAFSIDRNRFPPTDDGTAGPASMPQKISATNSWSLVASPNAVVKPENYMEAVTCVSASDCWAVGWIRYQEYVQTLIEHWNGTSWSVIPSPNTSATEHNVLQGVACTSASDCWAVGYKEGDSGYNQTLIEHWNGTSWSIIPSPNTSTTEHNVLQGVACTSVSDCWAVGSKNNQTLIQRWNGISWSIINAPTVGQFAQLNNVKCSSASDCWAVGSYNEFGSGYNQTLIEHWNGSSWSIVSSPNNNNPRQDNVLNGLKCVSASDCWAVGYYNNSSGYNQTLIEHWNGTSWSIVPSPNTSTTEYNKLMSVACTSTSNCWVAGDYYHPASSYVTQTLIEHWNGASWSIVSSPNTSGTQSNALNGVSCGSASECWAVGDHLADSGPEQALMERWDGSSWAIATPANTDITITNDLLGLTCASASECWGVGYSGYPYQQALIEKWDGSSWTVASSADFFSPGPIFGYQLNGVACASASECWSVGYYVYFQVPRYYANTLIEKWDGALWSAVQPPNVALLNFLNGVTCLSATDCWTVGYSDPYPPPPGAQHSTLIERWDGNFWAPFPSPNSKSENSVLTGVACTSSSDCWAVGNGRTGIDSHALIEHWNGTSWATTAYPDHDTKIEVLTSVTCTSASDCWAVGSDTSNDGIIQTLIERWNGSEWAIVASPNNATTRDNELNGVACASASNCWAVGDYINTGLVAQTLIEHWDGISWTIVASPNTSNAQENKLNSVTYVAGSTCWAAGHYLNGDGVKQTLIERWLSGTVQLVSAVSRKTHGGSTAFDINLPIAGNPGIECRSGGGSGNHQIIATFAAPVTLTGASVISGTGSVSGATVSASEITVNLTGVTNAQTILIRLAGVNDGTNSRNVDIPMGVLLGDTTGNGSVTSSDVTQTKSASGQTATASNFREDVTVNGGINASDTTAVKAAAGTALP
jgi:hypothetical protein